MVIMTKEVEGTVLVTGGNRGIGKAISVALAASGYNIIFTYKSDHKEARNTEKEIAELGVSVKSYKVDLISRESLTNFTQNITEIEPMLFALINNAGIYSGNTLNNTSNEEWDNIVSLNMSAPLLLARDLNKRIMDGGSIINISSVYGFRADPWAHAYQGTKAALIHMTRGLAKELSPRIRVNCVAPGYIKTDMNRSAWDDEKFNKWITKMTPMSRWGEPDDIAKAVKFLIDPLNSFITGHTLVLDGGIGL